MAVKLGTLRSMEDQAKISMLAVLGSDYGVSGYVDDLRYYQGNDSIRKAQILAKHIDNKESGKALVELVKESNDKMEGESHGGSRPGAGRKKTLPDGARPMAIKMTVEEREKVNEFLKELRADKK